MPLFSSDMDVAAESSLDKAEIFLTRAGGFVMIPHSAAIACAVRLKSPVTYVY